MQITLGPQYNVGEKPTVIVYIYIMLYRNKLPVLYFVLLFLGNKNDRTTAQKV